MVARSKPESGAPAEPSAGLLDSDELSAFLGTLRTATSIMGSTEGVLRELDAGITTREFDALVFIVAFGPLRPSELLRRVVLTHNAQTLSSVLDRLEASSLALREPHTEDARAVLIDATDAGRDLIASTFPMVYRRVIVPMTSEYSASELGSLSELLGRQ
ncbi:MAG: MarR family winged helix-turn-helix transcriptional regulator [Acidimicrobiia bacterium]